MIKVTRLDDRKIVINADLIESIEQTPDTLISFTTGRKLMVREDLEDVLQMVIDYRSKVHAYAIPVVRKEREDES
ncbi:MAG: endoflagellar protein [Candidatus Latescibacteria bacterium 4484_7]|nr:MAG: endoflagellar protein [Candidatus Latescibacteria bacterium 4484_7]